MTPAMFLMLAVFITATAALSSIVVRKVRRRQLRKLAAMWQMNYSPMDKFRLTQRIAQNFPVSGAARIHVQDLIYGTDDQLHRYIFTAEYTAGIVSGKKRVSRAGSMSECRDLRGDTPDCKITLAPANLPLLEQYRKLKPACARQAAG